LRLKTAVIGCQALEGLGIFAGDDPGLGIDAGFGCELLALAGDHPGIVACLGTPAENR
jgi:hypothetical protein